MSRVQTRSVNLRIVGRVQGVFFRSSFKAFAEKRGLVGWVRNEEDGSVVAVVQGEPAMVEEAINWARRGPPGARVDSVTITDLATSQVYRHFAVLQ
jgi:acylphosphatase